jgi:flagellar basal-body rod protein FlgF
MSDIYQIASIGLLDARQRLEAISLNAASSSLHGYRRHVVTGSAFTATLAATGATLLTDDVANTAAAQLAGAASMPVHRVDLQRGALVSTDRALDLAIEADDLFFALTDGRQTWLTRAGNFRIDEHGVLIGESGLRVVGTQGEVRLPGSDVAVASDGKIMHDGLTVGAVQLFRAIEPAALQASRGSLLLAPDGMQPAEPGEVRIRSGALEAANTDASREMLGLIAVSRQFEGITRIVQGYDELLGRTIQKLGEV